MKFLGSFCFLILLFCCARSDICDGTHFTFIDNSSLNQIVEDARNDFLSSRPSSSSVTTLGATILMSTDNETVWERGSYDGYKLVYPAR